MSRWIPVEKTGIHLFSDGPPDDWTGNAPVSGQVVPQVHGQVAVSTEKVSFHLLIIPCIFVLTGSALLDWQSLIPVTDHLLCICAHRLCVSALTESCSHYWSFPAQLCSQAVRFSIDSVSFPLLNIPYTFVLIACVFLHWQSLITITDQPLHICAHSLCVPAFTESHSLCWSSSAHLCSQTVRFCIDRVSFPSLISPCTFVLTGSALLDWQSLIHVTDHPLHICAHRQCVSALTDLILLADYLMHICAHRECVAGLTEPHSCHWSSPVHLCSQMVCFCIDQVSLPLLIIWTFVLTDSAFRHWQSLIPITDHPLCICAHRLCVSALTESHSICWLSPAHLCSQEVCCCIDRFSLPSLIIPCTFVFTESAFCIDRVSVPSLIIPCTPVLTGSAFLHWQSLVPIADHIIPCAFVLTGCVFLYWQSLNLIADHPLHICAHRKCVATLTESHSHC